MYKFSFVDFVVFCTLWEYSATRETLYIFKPQIVYIYLRIYFLFIFSIIDSEEYVECFGFTMWAYLFYFIFFGGSDCCHIFFG